MEIEVNVLMKRQPKQREFNRGSCEAVAVDLWGGPCASPAALDPWKWFLARQSDEIKPRPSSATLISLLEYIPAVHEFSSSLSVL